MGPSLIFDKSFLQGLTVDQAAMLDQLYQCVITPIFFVETLADLGKPENARRPPEAVVGGLAERSPVCGSAVNESHWSLAMASLAGHPMPLDYRPMMPGGVPVQVEGGHGVVFEKARETEAFERWQRGRFADVERTAASVWRTALNQMDLSEISHAFRAQLRKEDRPKDLEAAKALASRLMAAGGMHFRSFQLALSLFNLPDEHARALIENWKQTGRMPLRECAPYAAHCIEVMLFFCLAMSNGLISDQRPSNLIDMAYLFYLPFARIFASSDKLHRRVVPLFMTEGQAFVWGPELKDDLARADAYFAGLPEEERSKGLFLLASAPPPEAALIADHWDRFMPGWREREAAPKPSVPPDLGEDVVASSNAMMEAAAAGRLVLPVGEPERMVIQRFIPRTRGKWRMFSAEVESQEDRENAPRGA